MFQGGWVDRWVDGWMYGWMEVKAEPWWLRGLIDAQ
jgi:hypothetical protein